jgi:hypothetical protein
MRESGLSPDKKNTKEEVMKDTSERSSQENLTIEYKRYSKKKGNQRKLLAF